MAVSCILCAIVAGEAEASFVHRDPLLSAFMDTHPVTPGHLLVVPNVHVTALRVLDGETTGDLLRLGVRLAAALRGSDLGAEGVDFLAADGAAAGQEIDHVHLHVIPRFAGDGLVIDAEAWRRSPPTRARLDAQAASISRSLDQGSDGGTGDG